MTATTYVSRPSIVSKWSPRVCLLLFPIRPIFQIAEQNICTAGIDTEVARKRACGRVGLLTEVDSLCRA